MVNRPLRVAHINTEKTWRGGEQQAFSLIQGLNRKGHTNWVVARKNSLFFERTNNAGMSVHAVRPFAEWDFLTACSVRRWLIREKIDIVHAHASHAASLGALATLGTQIPLVISRRVDFHLSNNPFSKWKYNRAKKILAISKGVRHVLLEDGILGENIELVPSGIDFSRYQGVAKISHEEMGVPKDSFVIGQVAALEDHKDQETFLKAMSLLKKDIPQARAVLVGNGSLYSHLQDLTKSLELEETVFFLGYQDKPLNFLAGFDVFCLSSKLEGLGTSLLDAMALRVPVVATRTGGIPEIVENGETGYLVSPRNPSELAGALSHLIESGQPSPKILQNAFEKAKKFEIIHTISKTEEIYRYLSNKRNIL
ncbi:hypothetical protein BVX98_02710 [bacterium F11]|nr:hypothetical protein BVX98_02710 [bacterium F11]